MARSGADRSAITSGQLIPLLGEWAGSGGTLYERLANAVRDVIERGDVAPGTALPPERALARALQVSRGTVISAFDVLRDQRLLESRQGSGTRVRLDAPRPVLPDDGAAGGLASSRSLAGRLFADDPSIIDLAVALQPDASAVRQLALPASWAELERAGNGHGYAPQGIPQLREAICTYYQERGLHTDPDQVLVTAGAQQGIDLAAALALRPGDCVLLESPTYPGAIDAFARYGARIETVPFTSHWDQPRLLHDAVIRHAPRLLYLMPGLHNPAGRILPDARRREIARLADSHPLYVVEDNTLSDTAFERRDQPLIAAYTREGRVLTLGSLSKSAWGGLRIGWIRAHASTVSRLARAKAARDLSLSPLPQLVARTALDDLDGITSAGRAALLERYSTLTEALQRSLPDWTWNQPEGGLVLWVQLPFGNADDFTHHALRHGVAVIAGNAHCADGAGHQHIRIAYTRDPDVIRAGADRLTAAWTSYTRSLARAERRHSHATPLRAGLRVADGTA